MTNESAILGLIAEQYRDKAALHAEVLSLQQKIASLEAQLRLESEASDDPREAATSGGLAHQ